ncbi:MAG: carbohydrate-binding family 9-like protein [Calditrichia bacterium]
MCCIAGRMPSHHQVSANWEHDNWKSIRAETLTHHMGEHPNHFPDVQFKVAYCSEALYVIFRVEDQYVRAMATAHEDPVYEDSCVEFFFSPSRQQTTRYFNLEMNCCGKMLFHAQKAPREGVVLRTDERNKVDIAHTLKGSINKEIKTDITWGVEYRLPFTILEHYASVERPAPDTVWRANFYKCADKSSHPHWLTWAPVDHPKPDFHRPEFFGEIFFR